ncbi:MAG: hypothetical protein ACFE7R_03870 [Candidatus Hodarchaeota archaeon]
MTIDNEWKLLYSNNPKIQAFAVLKSGEIIWQTSNWDLVSVAKELSEASIKEIPRITISDVKYDRVTSSPEMYIASSENQGHLIMALVEKDAWVIAWATQDSAPELAVIDLSKLAVQLMRRL